MISLEVLSSLQAVGFLAAITSKLALARVGANPISAYHHDHLFFPREQAARALLILREMMDEQPPNNRIGRDCSWWRTFAARIIQSRHTTSIFLSMKTRRSLSLFIHDQYSVAQIIQSKLIFPGWVPTYEASILY